MFYYKLNFFYKDFIWQGTKGTKFKNFLSPQWLRNIKGKNIRNGELILFFQKKYTLILILLKMEVGILLV